MRERAKNRTAKLPRQCTPKVEPIFEALPPITPKLPQNFGKVGDGSVFPGARSRDISKPLLKLYDNVVQNFKQIREGLQVIEMVLGKDPRLENAKSIVELIFDEWRDENEVT